MTAAELRARLGAPGAPRLIDLRERRAFRAGHLVGAASVPGASLKRWVFLLPPRHRSICLIDRDGTGAAVWAALLTERGFRSVAWLDASVREVGPEWIETGDSEVVAWEPAPFLAEIQGRLTPGAGPSTGVPTARSAIDLACGSGRNAVFLGRQGWTVTGVDLLPDALRQARIVSRLSQVRGAHFHQADLQSPPTIRRWLPPQSQDAVLCFRYLDRALLPAIRAAVRPGGWIVMETFLEEQARVHGKPSRPAFLLQPGELRAAFADWEILLYREGPDEDDNRLASILARRP